MIEGKEIDSRLTEGIVLVECYEDETIQCLLKSIPIKEITYGMPKDTLFYKVAADDDLKEKYDLTELPALLVFKNKKLLGKVEGYYEVDQKDEFISKINELLK